MVVVRNWREQDPYLGHINALIWPLYRQASDDQAQPPELVRLQGMSGFVKHALQGRKHSDHHRHDNIEQMYYILKGRGELLIGEEKRAVQEGDAVYMPVNVPHQAFNNGDYWMEHLIVSCPLQDIREGTPAVRNWRDAAPSVEDHAVVAWSLLAPENTAPPDRGGVLQRMHGVTRQAVQGRRSTAACRLEGIEQVYYVLNGLGRLVTNESEQTITEGSAIYIPPGASHSFVNNSDAWLEFIVFAAPVGEAPSSTEDTEAGMESGSDDTQGV